MHVCSTMNVSSKMSWKWIIVQQTIQNGQYLYFKIKPKALIYLWHYQVCPFIYYPICPYNMSSLLLPNIPLKSSTGASFTVFSFFSESLKANKAYIGCGIITGLFFFQHNFNMCDHLQWQQLTKGFYKVKSAHNR